MRLSTSDRNRLLLLPLILWALQASDVFACAACTGSIPEPVRQAYNYSTAWLSFIPLIFLGSVVYTIYRMIKRANRQTEEQS